MKTNGKKVIVLVVFFMVLSFLAAQEIAKVDYVDGSVELTRNGVKIPRVTIGTRVENLDLITTSDNSSVAISFLKESGIEGTVQIVSKTSAVIRKDVSGGIITNEVQLFSGSVGLKVKKLAGSMAKTQVKTPTAVLGVRGTEFVVASFNGAVLTACKEGEVSCNPWSMLSGTRSSSVLSSVPGIAVEILETGAIKGSDFPKENFDQNWEAINARWNSLQIELVAANPLALLNGFANNWNRYAKNIDKTSSSLKTNNDLQKWINQGDNISQGYSPEVKEKLSVMKDLISIRPNMIMSIITMYRIEELLPNIPESAKNQRLLTGQTIKDFEREFYKAKQSVNDAISLFYTAEKLYMLRNDGKSPFMDF